MKYFQCIFIILISPVFIFGFQSSDFERFIVTDYDLIDRNNAVQIHCDEISDGTSVFNINGSDEVITFTNHYADLPVDYDHKGRLIFITIKNDDAHLQNLYHISKKNNGQSRIKKIPLWMSILPPLVTVLLALMLKEVVISLFLGILVGSFIAGGMRIESFYYLIVSVFDVINRYIIETLTSADHISIIVFSLLIGGMVAIISKNGGMAGVVVKLSKYAKSARSAQAVTWLLGIVIFFDDYANTLIVGNTMRSVTDKFKISREKLAYIVDATAAPVASIAFITTWIGAELGYIDGAVSAISEFPFALSPYALFVASLKYSFYPILTLVFILIIIYTKKDFGPMLNAEKRARSTGRVSSASTPEEDEPNMEDLSPVPKAPLHWYNAVIPVAVVIFVTILSLIDTGFNSIYIQLVEINPNISTSWSDLWNNMNPILLDPSGGMFQKVGALIGNADSYSALVYASSAGVMVAVLLTVVQKIIKLFDTMHYLVTGFKTLIPALLILTLAWSLASTTEDLRTAEFLTIALKDVINPYVMPSTIFVLAALIAFSTGSSWSTMAILYPLAIPTTWAICVSNGISPELSLEILLNVISVVLAASVLGDHCSPISDTTILSSLASDCNHLDHVKTQLPYALLVGGVSLACSFLSTFLGGGMMISCLLFIISIAALWLFVKWKGKYSTQ